jgi:succinate dehydrogenase/fumarate reductase flavoprotein subunit
MMGLSETYNTLVTDILVIGGGAAGAMAAYQAKKNKAQVILVSKGIPQHSGATVMAPGAIAGVGPWAVPGDSQAVHFQDTLKGGYYLNDEKLVEILVRESPGLILELEKIGALWQRDESGKNYALRIDGGHSFPRCPFIEDRTGREMLRTLFGEVVKLGVPIYANILIMKILVEAGKATGAIGLDTASGCLVFIRANAVILATGGAGNVYAHTSNPTDVTGDGFALALEAGAELMDMEFVQFYPLGFVQPASLRGILGALHYYIHLRNNIGERFMYRYDPERLELSTRDRVARAIVNEVAAGLGGPNGGVYADMTYHPEGYLAKMQPALVETYLKIGINPEKEALEVAPTCHFFMGGLRVDPNWQTNINGLYAIGECAAGVHGANRLSQNALAEVLVSGARAGRAAASSNLEQSSAPAAAGAVREIAKRIEAFFVGPGEITPYNLRQKLQATMWKNAGVIRSATSLNMALTEIKQLRALLSAQRCSLTSCKYNQELLEGIENHFLVATAEAIIHSALQREESRGGHFREDFPEIDDTNWQKHVLIKQSPVSAMQVAFVQK